jgi:hypothetical protein
MVTNCASYIDIKAQFVTGGIISSTGSVQAWTHHETNVTQSHEKARFGGAIGRGSYFYKLAFLFISSDIPTPLIFLYNHANRYPGCRSTVDDLRACDFDHIASKLVTIRIFL